MKKLLCVLLLLGSGLCLDSQRAANAAEMPWLRADGAKMVDEHNRQVVLGGMNLGGWLVEEPWMMPYETKPPTGSTFGPIKDHVTLWKVAQQRFGAAEANRIRTEIRNDWIAPADFDRIKAAGMNCVRLPFTYDLLQEPDGWAWIDKTLDWAKQRGIYVILDLHGAPGRQNDSDHSGEAGVNRLFKDPAMVRETEKVWAQIAARYKNHPEVAGYDVLNEPMGAPDASTLFVVTDGIYRAIRAVDTRHTVIIEDGYKGIDTFPRPDIVGWNNVMLSWHHYNFGAKSETEQAQGWVRIAANARKLQNTRPVPAFIGEAQLEPFGTPAAVGQGLTALQKGGQSWTMWTYKAAMSDGTGGMWGWYRANKPLEKLDVFRDTPIELLRKAQQMRTENLWENQGLTAMFKAVTQIKPVGPLTVAEVVSTARTAPALWSYTLEQPSKNWADPNFDASQWQAGPAGFGNAGWNFEGKVRTPWTTNNIWLRREFVLPANMDISTLQLIACHDDDAEVYINGVAAAKLGGYDHAYDEEVIEPAALATLKPGTNVIAVHCFQGSGDQYVDVGLLGSTTP